MIVLLKPQSIPRTKDLIHPPPTPPFSYVHVSNFIKWGYWNLEYLCSFQRFLKSHHTNLENLCSFLHKLLAFLSGCPSMVCAKFEVSL
ncbi:hypothetical protein HanXRQr2_Chr15g0698761 [Helianthus annuus]|uniref:Uncharacterized protein n=1 Tax=Helianthus annuus TaxID=4232 RepID=A0A251TX85_HELAN|nr:hypothetical protein HanXRQr2_Chr15g0698761 [Helianthus annuus]KAJ0451616.1 hypothetical protein HanHA300_Chr15g0569541 [Helianthus annuus]KAJ0473492.1 hypothetical protein HanHA89_Chr15g0618931 [Helianthus annuus]KAJ0649077.1 hypothetical protein HanLR1_Chr15g0580091 [Helianthus annuus]